MSKPIKTRLRIPASLLLVFPVVAQVAGCTGPYAWHRGPPASDGRGMMGYGPGGYGPMMGSGGYGYRGGMMGPGGGAYAPGPGYGYGYGPGAAGVSVQRHQLALRGGVPAAYADLRNPLRATPAVTAAGGRLYDGSCATCHGAQGGGNGPAAAGMSPPPADLRALAQRPIASDGYLMWTLSEGGAALGTPMPAFKGVLADKDRWEIIRYLRTL